MGWTPADVRAASLWEIHAAQVGHAVANGAKPRTPAPDVDAFDKANWDF